MLPREVIAQKTEVARQAYEAVSEMLARGGGKRATTRPGAARAADW